MKDSPFWKRTILAPLKIQSLKNELYNWASKHQCSIVWEDPDSPDLIAHGCCALFIDRTLIKMNFTSNI